MTAESTAVGPAAVALWRDGNFTRFWTGQALGQVGAQLGQLALAGGQLKAGVDHPCCTHRAPADRGRSLVLLVISEFGFGFSVLVYNVVQLTMRQRVCT